MAAPPGSRFILARVVTTLSTAATSATLKSFANVSVLAPVTAVRGNNDKGRWAERLAGNRVGSDWRGLRLRLA